MNYLKAKAKLDAYLEANWTYLKEDWADLLDKCSQAINDCLDIGLTGENDGEDDGP